MPSWVHAAIPDEARREYVGLKLIGLGLVAAVVGLAAALLARCFGAL